jgi:hypothetical protein
MKRARYAAELVEPADGQMKAIARQGEEPKPSSANIRMPLSPPASLPRSVWTATE